MRSRLDREISRRLLQEVPTEPTVKNSRIDQLLYRVRAEDVQDNSKVVRAFSYRTAVAAVGAVIILTTGTYAAVDKYHEHLQSMSQEEQKQLNHMTQAQREDADHYSRKLSSQEQKRKELLQKEYKKGTLPETKLKEVDSQKEVKANGGKEVVYCRANSTFYLPKSELTDEQLLQLIDFNERRDYALAKQNQADRARAAQRSVDETANKLTEDQAIEAAKQYVSKIYGLDTNRARAAVDVTTYEDSEDDEYCVSLSDESWQSGYQLLIDAQTGELRQIDEDSDCYMNPVKQLSRLQQMQTKHIEMIQNMLTGLEQEADIIKCKAIYVYDKDVPQMGASLKYFVQTKSTQVYVFGYNIDKDRVESLWITSDFEKTLDKEIADKKTMRKKDGLQIKIFNCINQ